MLKDGTPSPEQISQGLWEYHVCVSVKRRTTLLMREDTRNKVGSRFPLWWVYWSFQHWMHDLGRERVRPGHRINRSPDRDNRGPQKKTSG